MAVYQTYVNAMNDKIRKAININNPFVFKHISNLKVETVTETLCIFSGLTASLQNKAALSILSRAWITLMILAPAWWWRLRAWCRAGSPGSSLRAGAPTRGMELSSPVTAWRAHSPRLEHSGTAKKNFLAKWEKMLWSNNRYADSIAPDCHQI